MYYPIVGSRKWFALDVPPPGGFSDHIAGARQVLRMGVPFGGGFTLSNRRLALGAHILRAQNQPEI